MPRRFSQANNFTSYNEVDAKLDATRELRDWEVVMIVREANGLPIGKKIKMPTRKPTRTLQIDQTPPLRSRLQSK